MHYTYDMYSTSLYEYVHQLRRVQGSKQGEMQDGNLDSVTLGYIRRYGAASSFMIGTPTPHVISRDLP